MLTIDYPKEIEILMVEDNLGDIRLTQEAIKRNKLRVRLRFVLDGVEAMAYLKKEGNYSTVHRPDIILLDLNLPKKNGKEVLNEIKSDETLKCIPVVILTSSPAEEDVIKSYQLQANCFISKPIDLDSFIEIIHSIEHYWLSIVKLPPNHHF